MKVFIFSCNGFSYKDKTTGAQIPSFAFDGIDEDGEKFNAFIGSAYDPENYNKILGFVASSGGVLPCNCIYEAEYKEKKLRKISPVSYDSSKTAELFKRFVESMHK